jgi:hypothetical protein
MKGEPRAPFFIGFFRTLSVLLPILTKLVHMADKICHSLDRKRRIWSGLLLLNQQNSYGWGWHGACIMESVAPSNELPQPNWR